MIKASNLKLFSNLTTQSSPDHKSEFSIPTSIPYITRIFPFFIYTIFLLKEVFIPIAAFYNILLVTIY